MPYEYEWLISTAQHVLSLRYRIPTPKLIFCVHFCKIMGAEYSVYVYIINFNFLS